MEAIIDFRVTLFEDTVSANGLAKLRAALNQSFPQEDEFHQDSVELRTEPNFEPQAIAKRLLTGIRLTSSDKQRIVQISPAGFTYSRIPPYDRWETFRDEAKELWEQYKNALKPVSVTRAAVRYINRFDLPASEPFESYIKLFAEIPSEYPVRIVTGYFLQLQIPQTDINSTLVINQARVEPPNPETLSIILDFDLFRQAEWSIEKDAEIWEFLEELRTRKNLLFEASITDKTRELIQ